MHNFEYGDIVRLYNGSAPMIVIKLIRDEVQTMYSSGGTKRVQHRKLRHYDGDIDLTDVNKWRKQGGALCMGDRFFGVVDTIETKVIARMKRKSIAHYDAIFHSNSPAGGNETKNETTTLETGDTEMTKTLYTWSAKVGTTDIETEMFGHKLATNRAGMWVMEIKGTDEIVTVASGNVQKVMPYTVSCRYLGGGSSGYSFFAKLGEVKKGDIVYHPEYDTPLMVTAIDTKSEKATKWLKGSLIETVKVLTDGDTDDD
jgi:hypothetical protein